MLTNGTAPARTELAGAPEAVTCECSLHGAPRQGSAR